MGRIRTIKPEFPQSETIGKLSRDARLLFIQLWTFADDSGRARAASRMLASLLYPYDDDAPDLIDGWLLELETHACIRLYEVEGSKYLEIINWSKHQKVEKPSASRLPTFDEGSPIIPRPVSEVSETDLGPRTVGGDQEENCRKAPRRISYPALFETFWLEYPRDDGMSKAEALKPWLKLSEDDQQKAVAALPAFKAWARAQPTDYRMIHACNYLIKRRFDGFVEKAKAMEAAAQQHSTQVYVQYGTPAGDAWEQEYRIKRKKPPPRDNKGGWWFPTEYPEPQSSAA